MSNDFTRSEVSTSRQFPTGNGYLTLKTQRKFIRAATELGDMPMDAQQIPEITSLSAPSDPSQSIQFWQLYSVLGQEPIVKIVQDFYGRVFADEPWFRDVFARVGDVNHHVVTQASMWIDVMGGGPYYHGGEFRLSFHHTHNAHQLMDEKGAKRWVGLMVEALDACDHLIAHDPRIRPSINTFLTHFFAKYAKEFKFENRETFGPVNPKILDF